MADFAARLRWRPRRRTAGALVAMAETVDIINVIPCPAGILPCSFAIFIKFLARFEARMDADKRWREKRLHERSD
jgi:hypothetical protein